MSKGKRKSLPGVYQIVQQKLRSGTLAQEDRNTLHQLARLDLIELIENELGLQLKGSHKNSVAAMVEFLLGPEGGQVPGRRKPRRKTPLQLKKVAGQQHGVGTSAAAATAPRHLFDPDNQLQEGGDTTEASHPTGPESSATGADQRQQSFQLEQGNWLRELHMQLKAVQAGVETSEDAGALADDATTPARTVSAPQAWQSSHQQLEHEAMQLSHQQHPSNAAWSDEALETKLLDQLLRDMQLSPQPQKEQQQQALQGTPSNMSSQRPQVEVQPPQETWGLLQRQQQHPVLELQVPQQQESQLRQSFALPLPERQQQEQEQQEEQRIEQQLQQLLQQAALEQQQLRQGQIHRQGHQEYLAGSSQWQQSALSNPQPLSGSQPPPGGAAAAAAAGYHSCPLPKTTSCAPESWTGAIPTPAEYDTYALSATPLPVWQQQQQQQTDAGGTAAAAALKKRDRRQMFGQPASASGPLSGVVQDRVPREPLSVELSGPSADVTIKRMSFLAPGTGSVSALTTSTAGAAAADLQRRFAAAYGHQYVTESNEQQPPQQLQQQQQETEANLRQRSSFKKNMKGLAKRFRAFLKSRSSAQLQQQPLLHEPLRLPQRVAAAATVAEGPLDSSSDVYRPDSSLAVPVGHQHSSNTLADFRLASGTSNFGSFATNRAASAPGAFLLHPMNSQTSQASTDNFTEKLQVLRALYEYQYQAQQPRQVPPSTAAAATAVGGPFNNVVGNPVGLVPHDMPAVKEEDAELLGSLPPPAAAGDVVSKPSDNTTPLMQRLTRAFGLGTKVEDAEAAAAAVLSGAAGGLSMTERSNSSFSLFLARVASSWRQESSSTVATSVPLSSDKWPSSTTNATGRSRLSSFNTSNRQDSRSGGHLSWTSMEAAVNPAVAAAAAGGVEQSSGSFSQVLFGSCRGGDAAAAAGAAGVEASPGSFSRLFGSCAGEQHDHHQASAAAAPGFGVEGSRGSFTRLLGMCAGSSAAASPGGAGHLVEGSRGSFSQRVLGMCGGGGDIAAAGAPSAVEGSRGSFTHRVLGMCAGSDHAAAAVAAHAVESSRGSFTRVFGLCGGGDAGGGVAAAVGSGGVQSVQGSGRSLTQSLLMTTYGETGQDHRELEKRQRSMVQPTAAVTRVEHTAELRQHQSDVYTRQQEQGSQATPVSMDFQVPAQGLLDQATPALASVPDVLMSGATDHGSPTDVIVGAADVLATEPGGAGAVAAAAAGNLSAGADGSGELVEAPLNTTVRLSFMAEDIYGAGANI